MTYFEKHLFSPIQIREQPSQNLGMIVTIPCFNEPDLLHTMGSLAKCDPPNSHIEVIINVNAPENSTPHIQKQNQKTIGDFLSWNKSQNSSHIKYHLIQSLSLPKKHAGVGLARKIAMDEAVWRFQLINSQNGVIVCLDADCTVDQNYLREIENYFLQHPKAGGCSIYFEHPLEGNDFDEKIYSSIINYELFLRYYKLALEWTGFPYPYHTIGSSMAVRSNVYMKQGGMNRRKAGEDFYFLHKVFSDGGEYFGELNTTTVKPSPRTSARVPFGTGADISKQLLNGNETYTTYDPKIFADLKKLFEIVPLLYSSANSSDLENLPPSIVKFLEQESFEKKIAELKQHTASQQAFVKRFYKWFDGFKVLKFVHFARDNFYPQIKITEAVKNLIQKIGMQDGSSSEKELLLQLRKKEKNSK